MWDGQGLLLLMEFKFLIMMTRPQNIVLCHSAFCILVKDLNTINSRRPSWLPLLISHLFQPGVFWFLAATFYTQGVFGWGYYVIKT